MTPDQLAAAGRVLYGERWQTSLAADLDVTDRTMRRWLAGETPIPGGIEPDLRSALIKRLKDIGDLIEYAVNPADQCVFHYPTSALFRYDAAGNIISISSGTAHWKDVAALIEGAKALLRQPRSLKEVPFNPALLHRLGAIDFSVRTDNCLKNENIIFVGDLVTRTDEDLLRTPSFGRKSLNEIKGTLAEMGLHLGMEAPYWPPKNIDSLAAVYSRSTGPSLSP